MSRDAAILFCASQVGSPGGVLKCGYLTADIENSSKSQWSCSYFVLTATLKGTSKQPEIILYRFLAPENNRCLDTLKVTEFENHGLAILLRSEELFSWVLCCVSENETKEWLGAFDSASRGNFEPFMEDMKRFSELATNHHFPLIPESVQISQVSNFNEGSNLKYHSSSSSSSKKEYPSCTSDNQAWNALKDDFELNFGADASFETVQKGAAVGTFWGSKLRTILWRRLLGLLPDDRSNWAETLRHQRLNYNELSKLHSSSRSLLEGAGFSENQDRRRISHEYTENKLIEFEIWKDLERTRIFDDSFKQNMLRILFLWSKAHHDVGYVQGMNEILAIIYSVIDSEYYEIDAVEPTLLMNLMDKSYIEHDAYLLLDSILARLLPLYAPPVESEGVSCLPSKLEHIQHVLLQRTDPELAAILHCANVSPELYLVRWLRVIFAREIQMPQLLLIWDGIFARTPIDFSFIDAICVSLLTEPSVRQEIVFAGNDPADIIIAIRTIQRLAEDQVTKVLYESWNILCEYQHQMTSARLQYETRERNQSKDDDWYRIDSIPSDVVITGSPRVKRSSVFWIPEKLKSEATKLLKKSPFKL